MGPLYDRPYPDDEIPVPKIWPAGFLSACWQRTAVISKRSGMKLLKQIERYNGMKQDAKINFFENPITRFDIAIGSIGQRKVDVKDYLLETGSLLLFLLLVPALNLLGVTQSAVQKRRAESGSALKHLERLTACWFARYCTRTV